MILLSHPSLSGMADGSGRSGSTGWGNSVRSRLYFSRILADGVEIDEDLRSLTSNKPNYAKRGFAIRVRYDNGVFVREADEADLEGC